MDQCIDGCHRGTRGCFLREGKQGCQVPEGSGVASQAMTIDKNLNDMAYNTAMIINSLVAGSPVQASRSISTGGVTIPAFFSKVSLVTIDSISW